MNNLITYYGYVYMSINLVNFKRYIGQHKGFFNSNYYGSGNLLVKSLNKFLINMELKILLFYNYISLIQEKNLTDWKNIILAYLMLLTAMVFIILISVDKDLTFIKELEIFLERIILIMEIEIELLLIKIGINRKVCFSELDKYLRDGWNKGMLRSKSDSIKGKIAINNGTKVKYIFENDLDKFINKNKGWKKGSIGHKFSESTKLKISENAIGRKRSRESIEKQMNSRKDNGLKINPDTTGMIRINNGIKNKMIHSEELEYYESIGFVKGGLKRGPLSQDTKSKISNSLNNFHKNKNKNK